MANETHFHISAQAWRGLGYGNSAKGSTACGQQTTAATRVTLDVSHVSCLACAERLYRLNIEQPKGFLHHVLWLRSV